MTPQDPPPAGSGPGAPEDVFARYADRLVRVAEQHLSRKLAGRLDGEDVVQSAFRTFFRRSAAGEFRIDTSAQLWRLLLTITLRKARAQGRRHSAGKRAAAAEAGEPTAPLADDEPGPAEAAALVDQIEALLRGLPALYAQILERRLEGRPVAEIADQLGLSRQTIYRALNLLQERLTQLDPDQAAAEKKPDAL
jgi:RNA polymerase sigma-70 factor (ECF subfamily)